MSQVCQIKMFQIFTKTFRLIPIDLTKLNKLMYKKLILCDVALEQIQIFTSLIFKTLNSFKYYLS